MIVIKIVHEKKIVQSIQLASKSTNLHPWTQKTFGKKNTVSISTCINTSMHHQTGESECFSNSHDAASGVFGRSLERLGESGATHDSQSASRSGVEARVARNLNGWDDSDAGLSQGWVRCSSGLASLHHSRLSTRSPHRLYSFSGDRRVCYDNCGSFVYDSPNLFFGPSGSVRTGLTGVQSEPEHRTHLTSLLPRRVYIWRTAKFVRTLWLTYRCVHAHTCIEHTPTHTPHTRTNARTNARMNARTHAHTHTHTHTQTLAHIHTLTHTHTHAHTHWHTHTHTHTHSRHSPDSYSPGHQLRQPRHRRIAQPALPWQLHGGLSHRADWWSWPEQKTAHLLAPMLAWQHFARNLQPNRTEKKETACECLLGDKRSARTCQEALSSLRWTYKQERSNERPTTKLGLAKSISNLKTSEKELSTESQLVCQQQISNIRSVSLPEIKSKAKNSTL